jgi:hypothetical protein
MRRVAAWIGLFLAALALFGREDEKPSTPSSAPQPTVVAPVSTEQPAKASAPDSSATTQTGTKAKSAEAMYVTGNGVAFRAGPGTEQAIIDRFDKGREVLRIDRRADWSQVRDQLTQRRGWIATRFLSNAKPERQAPRDARPSPMERAPSPKQQAPSRAILSDATIVQRIIAQSIAGYPGSCPCPYSRDRGGRRCGARSAYSKPGGYAPICFAEDVSRDMIAAFRNQ